MNTNQSIMLIPCDWFDFSVLESGETAELVANALESVTMTVQEEEDGETVTVEEVVDGYAFPCVS